MNTPDSLSPHLGIIPRPAQLDLVDPTPVITVSRQPRLRLSDDADPTWQSHLRHWSAWLEEEIAIFLPPDGDRDTANPAHLRTAQQAVPTLTDIQLHTDPALPEQGYRLRITDQQAHLIGADYRGIHYGLATIVQLIGHCGLGLPRLEIRDAPRYRERGILVDPARSFLAVEEIRTLIDLLARYKFNRLHLHLTDDQGWRIDIPTEPKHPGDPHDYRRLAQISGATAVGPTVYNREPGDPGYYRGEQLRELCAYAAARAITIIPEFDIPAHTRAALHALPALNSARSYPPADPHTGCAPAFTATDVGESSLDPDNPATYAYIEHVSRALLELTGGPALHLGGDESHSTDDRAYAQLMSRALPQVANMSEKPQIIVWNEAVDKCQLPVGTTVQIWTGQASPALREHVRTRSGAVLVSSAPHFYLAQRPAEDVPSPTWARGGPLGLEQVLAGDPTELATVAESAVAGVEATIWNEHLRTLAGVTFMALPRALAVAEIGWSARQTWDEPARAELFTRIAAHEPSFLAAGLTYHAAPEISWPIGAGAQLAPGMITAEEAKERARAHWRDAPLITAAHPDFLAPDAVPSDFLTGPDLTVEVSSQETVGEPLPHGRVRALSDGSPESYWHTRWKEEVAPWPPVIDISWNHPRQVRAIALAQRPHSPMAGSVSEVAISTPDADGDQLIERTRVRLDPTVQRVRIALPPLSQSDDSAVSSATDTSAQAQPITRVRLTILDSLGGRGGERGTAQHSSSAAHDWQPRQIAALSEVAIEVSGAAD